MSKEEELHTMSLWDNVCETDPKYTKEVGFGRKFTSINAQYQLREATRQFGPYGILWGIKAIKYSYIDLPSGEMMALAEAKFAIPDGEFAIASTIMVTQYNKKAGQIIGDDEWAKKVETDITTKALSKLGFSADVFLGRYDDNRYVNSLRTKFDETRPSEMPKPTPPKKKDLDEAMYERMKGAVDQGMHAKVKASLSGFNEGKWMDAIQILIAKAEVDGKKSSK